MARGEESVRRPARCLEEVSQVITVPPPANAAQALGMLRSAISYLAAVDATAMAAETPAQSLQALEQVNSMGTAARTSILAAFSSGQGYCAEADYSPRAWLINRTRVTKGAAVAYTAWVRRAAAHPEVVAALAAGEMSESFARTICTWTDRLPEDCQEDADEILLAAAGKGMDLRDLAGLVSSPTTTRSSIIVLRDPGSVSLLVDASSNGRSSNSRRKDDHDWKAAPKNEKGCGSSRRRQRVSMRSLRPKQTSRGTDYRSVLILERSRD